MHTYDLSTQKQWHEMTAAEQLHKVIMVGLVGVRRARRKAYDGLNECPTFSAYQGLVMAAFIDEVPF